MSRVWQERTNTGQLSYEYDIHSWTKRISSNTFEEAGYDENGNIESLHRNGLQQTGKYGAIDDLRMTYDGNKLSSVVESAPSVLYANSLDLKSGSDEIAYNGNGSLIMDGTRGITAIEYDRNNNPQRIQFNNGNVTAYIYTSTGRKLRTVHYSAAPDTHVNMGEQYTGIDKNYLSADSTDYLMNGSLILENGKVDKMLFDGGYIQARYSSGKYLMKLIKTKDMSDDEYRKLLQHWLLAMSASRKINGLAFYYFNKDHLGNIREVVDTEGLIHQTNDYYPFGTPFSNSQSDVSFQKYKYNGKELDMMHGLNTYDYDTRPSSLFNKSKVDSLIGDAQSRLSANDVKPDSFEIDLILDLDTAGNIEKMTTVKERPAGEQYNKFYDIFLNSFRSLRFSPAMNKISNEKYTCKAYYVIKR